MEAAVCKKKIMFTNKALFMLIAPLVVEQLLAVTVGMADTVMVSVAGEPAVSGISLVDNINLLFIQIFSALATGGAVVASHYLGRQDSAGARSSAKQLVYVITALASFLMIIVLAFNRVILHMIFGNIEPDVMQNAETYFLLSAISYPFLAVYSAGAALFRSMGNSKISMQVSLVMNIVNISGNALLIYVFHWGVAGAATASLVSRVLAAVIMLNRVTKKTNVIYVENVFKPEFKWPMCKRILRIGIPNGVENGMFQVGKLIVQGLIASLGTSAIAANAISNSLASLTNVPGAAIGLGMITVVGQCVGAGDYKQAVGYTKKLVLITGIFMMIINIAMFILAGPLISLFNLSAEAMASAERLIRHFAIASTLVWSLAFTTPNALRAAGDAKFTMIVSLISMWVFRIGFSYLFTLAFNLGLDGVWFAMYVDWVARALCFTIRFLRGKWKKLKVV